MTYTSEVADHNPPLADISSLSNLATSALPALSRTQGASHTAAPRSAEIDEIAGDSAKVSLAGAMLSQATAGSDARFDKIAALRQSIETGVYAPTSQAVAAKLIGSLQT
jgi:anti-sigma28 factor (negative regulator of flagellin synthesis)